jgi:hypothetical protein
MDTAEDRGALDELAREGREDERLRALAEYAALRRRWQRGADQPGDLRRRRAARAVVLAQNPSRAVHRPNSTLLITCSHG